MEFSGNTAFCKGAGGPYGAAVLVSLFYAGRLLKQPDEKYPDGMIKRLVLDQKKSWKRSIFRVDGILEQRIIVALPLAESMLRRRMTGVSLLPVMFGGG